MPQFTSCHRRRRFSVMKDVQVQITVLLCSVCLITGITVKDVENGTLIVQDFSSTTESNDHTDNGMAVGEPPEVEPTSSDLSPAIAPSLPFPTLDVTEPVLTPFPENHKNFSGSSYLGTIESPPSLASYTQYQQQYKEFHDQKKQYMATARPVRFEEVPVPYIPPAGLSSYGDDVQVRHKPYPHWFDGWKVEQPEQAAYPLPENNFEPEAETPSPPSFMSTISNMGSSWSNLFGMKKPELPSSGGEGQRSEISVKHKSAGSWKKIMKVLTTVLPFGLFLATLTSNLLYINTTEENKPSRFRSLDDSSDQLMDPLVQLVQKYGGLEAMEDPKCEDRFFCEMSVLGKNSTSNFVERGFWYLANETPDQMAEEVGMKELFHAIKNNNCQIFECKIKESQKEESISKPKKHKKYPKKASET